MDLLIELKNIVEAFDKDKIDYALCGGLALAVYARPRATLDIDIMVEPELLGKIKKIVENLGFNIPATPMSFKGGAVQIHRMTKVDNKSGEHLVLDLLLVTPQTKISWDSKISVDWEGGTLRVLSPEGLITLKSLRKSGQDIDDIEYLKELIDED
ncbi:MAG: nucleotidyltransferase family protein [Deltaproteobacteria bacterium]|nr:nucleotidyltransferase family protein [Deltaproteobacteria bacterium]